MSQRARTKQKQRMQDTSDLEFELTQMSCIKVQSIVRRFLVRSKVVRMICSRYEKIWDPKRRKHYYYDTVEDLSSWEKPVILLWADIPIVAATYTNDQACILIQRQARRRQALKVVRMLYQKEIQEIEANGPTAAPVVHYVNSKTGYTSWRLPAFMNNRLDYSYSSKKKKGFGDADDYDDDDESLDSLRRKEKKKSERTYPRSKLQEILDIAEDNPGYELDLSNTGAERISSRLYDMTTLEVLNLSNNYLTSIHSNIQYLSKLQTLDVSNNWLKDIPKQIEECTQMRVFLASNNMLSWFPGYFYKMRDIVELDLSHNLFVELPIQTGSLELLRDTSEWEVGIGLLSSLVKLDISHNYMSEWPKQLERVELLQTLNLSYNKIVSIPDTISKNSSIQVLLANNNRIQSVPYDLYLMQQVVQLDLSHNVIESMPPLPKNDDSVILYSIEAANLSNNRLVQCPPLGVFAPAITLNLSHNLIPKLHTSIERLNRLLYLYLSHNNISEIPMEMGRCKALKVLDISFNAITELPVHISLLKDLTDLNLSHNQLIDVSKGALTPLTKLEKLDLSNNKLSGISSNIYQLRHLNHLDLSDNAIVTLDPQIGTMGHLRHLNLSRNRITGTLPPTMSLLIHLKHLELQHNCIVGIPLELSSLCMNLTTVYLHHNCLNKYPEFRHKLSIKYWDFSGNPALQGGYIDWLSKDNRYDEANDIMELDTYSRRLNMHLSAFTGIINSDTSACNAVSTSDAIADRSSGLMKAVQWNRQLRIHICSHSISHAPARRQHRMALSLLNNGELEVLSPVAPSTDIYLNFRDKNDLQFHMLCNKYARTLPRSFSLSSMTKEAVAATPSIEIMLHANVDLGHRYYDVLQSFLKLAHELSAIAYDQQVQKKLADKQAKHSIEAKKSKQRSISIASDSTATPLGVDSLLQLAFGMAPEGGYRKCDIVNFNDIPRILFHPCFDVYGDFMLYQCAIDTYLAIATIMVCIVDKVTKSIRKVETAGNLQSSLGVADRCDPDDVVDLVQEIYDVVSGQAELTKIKMQQLNEKKNKANSFINVALGDTGIAVNLDDDSDDIETKQRLQEEQHQKQEKDRKQAEIVPILDDVVADVIGSTIIPVEDSKRLISYLLSNRRHLLLFATKLMDSVSELLSVGGWEPLNNNYSDNVRDRVSFSLEDNCINHRSLAIRAAFLRGRVYQMSGFLSQALDEYESVLKLSKEKSIRHVLIEMIKTHLQLKEFPKAKKILDELVYQELIGIEDDFPRRVDLLRLNKQIGLFYLYIDVYEQQYKKCSYKSNQQRVTYSTSDDGLLTRSPIVALDTIGGRVPRDHRVKLVQLELQQKVQKQIEEMQSSKQQNVKTSNIVKKYRNILNDSIQELNAFVESDKLLEQQKEDVTAKGKSKGSATVKVSKEKGTEQHKHQPLKHSKSLQF